MRYEKPILAKLSKEKDKVSVSIAVAEDSVITKKVTIDEFRMLVSQFNQVIYEIDNGE